MQQPKGMYDATSIPISPGPPSVLMQQPEEYAGVIPRAYVKMQQPQNLAVNTSPQNTAMMMQQPEKLPVASSVDNRALKMHQPCGVAGIISVATPVEQSVSTFACTQLLQRISTSINPSLSVAMQPQSIAGLVSQAQGICSATAIANPVLQKVSMRKHQSKENASALLLTNPISHSAAVRMQQPQGIQQPQRINGPISKSAAQSVSVSMQQPQKNVNPVAQRRSASMKMPELHKMVAGTTVSPDFQNKMLMQQQQQGSAGATSGANPVSQSASVRVQQPQKQITQGLLPSDTIGRSILSLSTSMQHQDRNLPFGSKSHISIVPGGLKGLTDIMYSVVKSNKTISIAKRLLSGQKDSHSYVELVTTNKNNYMVFKHQFPLEHVEKTTFSVVMTLSNKQCYSIKVNLEELVVDIGQYQFVSMNKAPDMYTYNVTLQ